MSLPLYSKQFYHHSYEGYPVFYEELKGSVLEDHMLSEELIYMIPVACKTLKMLKGFKMMELLFWHADFSPLSLSLGT